MDIDFIFQPRTAVRDDRCGIGLLTGFIDCTLVVHTGRTDNLRNDDTFRTIDNERTVIGHQREITDVNLALLHFTGFLIGQTYEQLQRGGIVCVTLFAFLHRINRCVYVQFEIDEFKRQVA